MLKLTFFILLLFTSITCGRVIKETTYIPFSWDLENLIDQVSRTLDNYKNNIILAHNAQSLYKKHTIDKYAFELFYRHFINLLF